MTLDSVDNGHSFAGKYGLGNPTVTWLINRGYGELVALTPAEMQRPEVAPVCRAQREESRYGGEPKQWFWTKREGQCGRPMLYRTEGWVCYEHESPVRVKRPPRLQKIPPPPFSSFEVIGKTVEVVYRKEGGEARPRWHYVVDGQVRS